MPLVYNQFKIDSARFQTSNLYYMSKIDLYQKIFEDAKVGLEKQKKVFDAIKTRKDSIRKDSFDKIRNNKIIIDDKIELFKKKFKPSL